MAQNTEIALPRDTWVLLTDADVTSLTFQVFGSGPIYVAGAASATAPTDFTTSLVYRSGQGEINKTMADMYPGITAVRVYAYCGHNGRAIVSHA